MPDLVPVVPVEHLITANQKAVEDRERYGRGDVWTSIVAALAKKIPSETVLAALHRLTALANTLKEGEGKPWRIDLDGQEYTLLDEALFRAAARAPLEEAEYIADLKFDTATFLQIALEESETQGRS